MSFSELCVTTNFTFLTGASHPEEYIRRAFKLNLKSIAITDINSVSGVVRGHRELLQIKEDILTDQNNITENINEYDKKVSIPKFIPGSCLKTNLGIYITALPININGWSNLCSLLSKGYQRSKKGECNINLKEVTNFSKDLILLLHPPHSFRLPFYQNIWKKEAKKISSQCKKSFIIISPKYNGLDNIYFEEIINIGKELNLKPVASSTPIMHNKNRRELVDILTCIRLKKTIDKRGAMP